VATGGLLPGIGALLHSARAHGSLLPLIRHLPTPVCGWFPAPPLSPLSVGGGGVPPGNRAEAGSGEHEPAGTSGKVGAIYRLPAREVFLPVHPPGAFAGLKEVEVGLSQQLWHLACCCPCWCCCPLTLRDSVGGGTSSVAVAISAVAFSSSG